MMTNKLTGKISGKITGKITGKTLIGWGCKPGPWFAEAVAAAERARLAGADEVAIRAIVERFAPPPGPPTIGCAGLASWLITSTCTPKVNLRLRTSPVWSTTCAS